MSFIACGSDGHVHERLILLLVGWLGLDVQIVVGLVIYFQGEVVAWWWAVVASLPARALDGVAHCLAWGAQQANAAVQQVAEGALVAFWVVAQPVGGAATGAASGARAVADGFRTGWTLVQMTVGSLSSTALTIAASMALEAAGSVPLVRQHSWVQ